MTKIELKDLARRVVVAQENPVSNLDGRLRDSCCQDQNEDRPRGERGLRKANCKLRNPLHEPLLSQPQARQVILNRRAVHTCVPRDRTDIPVEGGYQSRVPRNLILRPTASRL